MSPEYVNEKKERGAQTNTQIYTHASGELAEKQNRAEGRRKGISFALVPAIPSHLCLRLCLRESGALAQSSGSRSRHNAEWQWKSGERQMQRQTGKRDEPFNRSVSRRSQSMRAGVGDGDVGD